MYSLSNIIVSSNQVGTCISTSQLLSEPCIILLAMWSSRNIPTD
jgi:hypothetical protein